ncbi:MAG TPA: hypothetical protein VFK79_04625 [Xanthobacteraceae bacterium]|nr:hypothetical protein [Xanthobacteraceae bacterium]
MAARVNNRTPLYILCSPQPRVGRTLIARLLIDFFLMEDRPAAGFDFVVEPPALIDFLPHHTVQASIASIEGQMALFDGLIMPDHTAKVVDLAPASFQQFFSVMAEIGFVEDAHQRGIEPVALFIAAPDPASQRAYAELQRALPELVLVPVYNEAIARGQRARQNFPPARTVSLPIQIPALAPHLHRYLERPPFSFADFRSRPPHNIPLDTYMELLRWMRRAFVEFRELELRLLLGDVRASLLRGAS